MKYPGYVSAAKLAEAKAEGRELIGPAQAAPGKEGRFSAGDFQINVEARTALCPAGKTSTQCSRLVVAATGKCSAALGFVGEEADGGVVIRGGDSVGAAIIWL